LNISRRRNSVASSRADSSVKVGRSNVAGTEFLPIFNSPSDGLVKAKQRAKTSWIFPLIGGTRTPPRAQAERNSTYHTVGQLFMCFGFHKSSIAPWS